MDTDVLGWVVQGTVRNKPSKLGSKLPKSSANYPHPCRRHFANPCLSVFIRVYLWFQCSFFIRAFSCSFVVSKRGGRFTGSFFLTQKLIRLEIGLHLAYYRVK